MQETYRMGRILRTVGGRKVGILKPNGDYIIHRNTTKHYFIKFKGYGISTSIIEQLRRTRIWKRVVLILTGVDNCQKVFYATPQNFIHDAEYYVNKGEPQRILNEKYWKKKGSSEQKILC